MLNEKRDIETGPSRPATPAASAEPGSAIQGTPLKLCHFCGGEWPEGQGDAVQKWSWLATRASAPVAGDAQPVAVVRDNPEGYGTIIDQLVAMPVGTLLHAAPQASLAAAERAPVAGVVQPVELRAVTETIKEGDGFWRSCTGCHELNEGHDTGPYSAVLQCQLGNGCSECGGIGAIWDNTDYQAMADDMARDIGQSVAPQASPAADGRDAKDAARKTAGNIREPLNGDGWRVHW